MSVGTQTSAATISGNLTNISVALRNIMTQVKNLNSQVNGGGGGLAYLESIGFSSAANPNNPGGISDAQYALNLVGYLNTVCGCYMGTVQQGGSGGTGAILFNFDTAFAPLWAGQ